MTSMKDDACSEQLRRKAERERPDWLADLGEDYTSEQEAALIDRCLLPYAVAPIKWVGVPVKHAGHEGVICVGADALSLLHPFGHIRVNLSCRGAQRLCDQLGLQMPTPLMVEAVWKAATLRLSPRMYLPDRRSYVTVQNRQIETVHVSMMGITAMIAHSDRVEAGIQGAPELVCNVGKWWVICKAIDGQSTSSDPKRSYKAANYGWFVPGAPNRSVTGQDLWQPVSTFHNARHRDYSQTFVPVGRLMLVDGAVRSVAEVLRSTELCGLISHEGPLSFDRHPNLPPWTEQPDDRSPDPKSVSVVAPAAVAPPEAPTRPNGKTLSSFVQARNYTPCKQRKVDLVVIHTMENPEKPKQAREVANWFASAGAPKASAHYCLDDSETVQCLQEHDIAWCAPGANHNGVHLEHAGYASQNVAQWNDVYSRALLIRSATLCARICERHAIPNIYVTAEGLLEGRRGITTHAQVTKACALAKTRKLTGSPFFKAKTTHTDPGPNFPINAYLEQVQSCLDDK